MGRLESFRMRRTSSQYVDIKELESVCMHQYIYMNVVHTIYFNIPRVCLRICLLDPLI
jgi:hypothetical protein